MGRELPSDFVICVTRGGGGSEVLRPTGLGLTDGLGAGEAVGGVKSLGSGIETGPGGGRGLRGDIWAEFLGNGRLGEDGI